MNRSSKALFLAAAMFASGALAKDAVIPAPDMTVNGSSADAQTLGSAAQLKIKTLTRARWESASSGATVRVPRAQDQQAFHEMDHDNDGYLSPAELWRADPRPGSGWMAMDRDNDGRISPPEFAAIR